MNKSYFVWPVIGLLVFGVFYWNFSQEYAQKQKDRLAKIEKDRQERITQEMERRNKAIQDATKAQIERNAARHAKEVEEQRQNDLRDALMERRQHAFEEVNRHLRPQLDREKGDADVVKGDIAQLELQKKQFLDEEAFIRKFTRIAEANVKTYYDLLDKIKAAEDAHAAAEAAAKAAKKE